MKKQEVFYLKSYKTFGFQGPFFKKNCHQRKRNFNYFFCVSRSYSTINYGARCQICRNYYNIILVLQNFNALFKNKARFKHLCYTNRQIFLVKYFCFALVANNITVTIFSPIYFVNNKVLI